MSERVTLDTLQEMKQRGEKIASLTAYDASFAILLEQAGIDAVLVGDSLGMVLHAAENTLAVRMQDMIYHSRIVRRGLSRPLLITDLPFMSYTSPAQALGNAARLVSEGGAQLVKLEGGAEFADTVQLLSRNGIPVCAHLGLTPQSVLQIGGYRIQGQEPVAAQRLLQDAETLQQAGAVLLVVECIPPELAARVTAQLSIPVIGIGAGADCDGQVLVLYDMLGISLRRPSFSHNFLPQAGSVDAAIQAYTRAVKAGQFPGPAYPFN